MARKPNIFSYGAAEGTQTTSFADIIDLINSMQQSAERKNIRNERKISNQSTNLENLIKLTSDIDSMESLRQRIDNADLSFDEMGDDLSGDVLKGIYNQKYDIMQKGQTAYDELNKMNLEITDQESFKKASKNVLDMDWAEVNNNMRKLFSLENDLTKATSLNIKFKGSDEISPELLKTTITQYKNLYNNKLNMLAQKNVFDIPDEQIQAFDEEFGVALMTYSPQQFGVFMGNHQKLIQTKLKDAEQKRNMYYNHYINAGERGGFAEVEDELGQYGEVEPGTLLAASLYEEKYKEYEQLAQLLNERHKEFYGSHFSDNPSLTKGYVPTDENILNNAVDNFLDSQGKEKKDEEDKKEDDKKIISPPEYSISLDISTPIEKTVVKSLKPKEFDESIKTSNFINKNTNKKINIVSYDKDNNIYIDSDGNKLSSDSVAVISIDDIRPKIKMANGKPYYFNPQTNKVEEWGSNETYKKQKIEKMIINGREEKVPVIHLGYWTDKGNKLYWMDGQWKHLEKAPYKPSWQK
tara:strand:- start:2123 stop:3694 length:1572 start_codon:yes stop_codon:yes gene_type:complete